LICFTVGACSPIGFDLLLLIRALKKQCKKDQKIDALSFDQAILKNNIMKRDA
jgi:hypothetical protein